jgi:two-component system chemotaxis response regulator CheB
VNCGQVRVLVVEDSAFMRKALSRILESDPGILVVDRARTGEEAIEKALELRPDVVTMDIHLPGIDGITAMQHILNRGICPVIVISALTAEGSVQALEALELGAFDCIYKPGGSVSLGIGGSAAEIVQKVKAAARGGTLERIRRTLLPENRSAPEAGREKSSDLSSPRIAVALGISTGGPAILARLVSRLPQRPGAAIFIVQHMPRSFTETFARRLDRLASFPVCEAAAGQPVRDNHAYLARGGRHLVLYRSPDGAILNRLTSNPDCIFKPSVDVMMESVLDVFGRNTVGVLMTGMGSDGALGMERIRRAGGYTIAESEETAVVYGMPRAAVERGAAIETVPAHRMAEAILSAIGMIRERMEEDQ